MQFERLVRQFMPKFGKPVVTSSRTKALESANSVETKNFELIKK